MIQIEEVRASLSTFQLIIDIRIFDYCLFSIFNNCSRISEIFSISCLKFAKSFKTQLLEFKTGKSCLGLLGNISPAMILLMSFEKDFVGLFFLMNANDKLIKEKLLFSTVFDV